MGFPSFSVEVLTESDDGDGNAHLRAAGEGVSIACGLDLILGYCEIG